MGEEKIVLGRIIIPESEEDRAYITCYCTRVIIREFYEEYNTEYVEEYDSSVDVNEEENTETASQAESDKSNNTQDTDLETNNRSSDCEIDYISLTESMQMAALGLPTSFGKQRKRNKRNNHDKKKQGNILNFIPDYSEDPLVIEERIAEIFNRLRYSYKSSNSEDLEDTEVLSEMSSHTHLDENAPTDSTSDIQSTECEETVKEIPESEDIISKSSDLSTTSITIKKKNKKKKKLNKKLPSEILENKKLLPYWSKRFSLFSLFDQGIRLDEEAWFSTTPENIAKHTAKRLKCDIIVDGFCGIGGNAIQFAQTCNKVIAIDIDPKKIEMAKHNARIYNVLDKIEFIVGDFLQLCSKLKADVVFLSPPWGGPNYKKLTIYDIEKDMLPVAGSVLFEKCKEISSNIAIYLPRNTNSQQLAKLAGVGNSVEIEQNFIQNRLIALTAYYGGLVQDKS